MDVCGWISRSIDWRSRILVDRSPNPSTTPTPTPPGSSIDPPTDPRGFALNPCLRTLVHASALSALSFTASAQAEEAPPVLAPSTALLPAANCGSVSVAILARFCWSWTLEKHNCLGGTRSI